MTNKFTKYESQQLEKITKLGYIIEELPDPLKNGALKISIYNVSNHEIISFSKKIDSIFPFQVSPDEIFQNIGQVLKSYIPEYTLPQYNITSLKPNGSKKKLDSILNN